ncbi:hypothetical protein ACFFRR_008709 [Megaselia abdita]
MKENTNFEAILSYSAQNIYKVRCFLKEMRIRVSRLQQFMKTNKGRDYHVNPRHLIESDYVESQLLSDLQKLLEKSRKHPELKDRYNKELNVNIDRLLESVNRSVNYIEQVVMSFSDDFGYLGIKKEALPKFLISTCSFIVDNREECVEIVNPKLNKKRLMSFETCLSYKTFFDSVYCLCIQEVDEESFTQTVINILLFFVDPSYLCEFCRSKNLKSMLQEHPSFYGLIKHVTSNCVFNAPGFINYRSSFDEALCSLKNTLKNMKIGCRPASDLNVLTRSSSKRR